MANLRTTSYFLACLTALPALAQAERLPYHAVQEMDRRKGYPNNLPSVPPTVFSEIEERERFEKEQRAAAEEAIQNEREPEVPPLTKQDIENILDKKMGKPTKAELETREAAKAEAAEQAEANKHFGTVGGIGKIGGIGEAPAE